MRNIDDVGIFYNDAIDDGVKSYILGLILTDGCIRSNGFSKSICISLKDEYMINMIRNVACPTKKVYKDGNNRQVVWRNARDIEFLANVNVAERKTYTVRLPTVNDMSALIRGIFDGDGSVFTSVTHDNKFNRLYKYTYVSITSGSGLFLYDIQNFLKEIDVSSRIVVDKRHKSTSQLRITRKNDVKKFKNFIYTDETIWKLERKYDKFKSV